MKEFKVSKHPLKNKYKAVKVGFSWPGLIFGGGWMLFKGLIFRGIIFLILAWALLLHNMVLQIEDENKSYEPPPDNVFIVVDSVISEIVTNIISASDSSLNIQNINSKDDASELVGKSSIIIALKNLYQMELKL